MTLSATFVQPGDVITVAAPYARNGGQGALLATGLFGVAGKDLANAEAGPFYMYGVWTLTKTTSEAWTVGAKIYWDNSAKSCTTTSSGNTLIGNAVVAAGSSATTGTLRLNGVGV